MELKWANRHLSLRFPRSSPSTTRLSQLLLRRSERQLRIRLPSTTA